MVAKFKKIKKRDEKENVFFSILLGFLFIGVLGFLIFSNTKINQRRAELMSQIESLKKEIQTLEKKNTEFRSGIIETQTEDYQKGELYEQGYIEEGAKQVVVLPPKEENGTVAPQSKNLWQKLLEKLHF